jgi:hypothetical protein
VDSGRQVFHLNQNKIKAAEVSLLISLLVMNMAAWAHDSSMSDAAVKSLHEDSLDPEMLNEWQNFVKSGEVRVVEVKIHPNEAQAVAWMNHRLERMGIPNLNFKGVEEEAAVDPTALDNEQIRGKKWIRYSAGPGVAAAAFFLGLPAAASNGTDYLYLIIPAASAGVTTVALEMQFAWPWLNNVFWKKVWKAGGAVGGRLTNIFVNFLYGMSIFASTRGGEHLAAAMGGAGTVHSLGFTQAVVGAAIGAVTFHLAMGQYQTDIAREEERGAITASTRYGLETNGVLVNNSARVLSWVLPGGSVYGSVAQAAFFIFKTFPQLLKTNFMDGVLDRGIGRRLNGEALPHASLAERCALLLQR